MGTWLDKDAQNQENGNTQGTSHFSSLTQKSEVFLLISEARETGLLIDTMLGKPAH